MDFNLGIMMHGGSAGGTPGYGPDLFLGAGAFNTQADFDSFFKDGVAWTWDAGGFAIRPAGTMVSHFHKQVPTVTGRTYLLQATANITSGDAEYFVGTGIIGTTVGEDYEFIAGSDNLIVGVVSANGDFNFDNLTLREEIADITVYFNGEVVTHNGEVVTYTP